MYCLFNCIAKKCVICIAACDLSTKVPLILDSSYIYVIEKIEYIHALAKMIDAHTQMDEQILTQTKQSRRNRQKKCVLLSAKDVAVQWWTNSEIPNSSSTRDHRYENIAKHKIQDTIDCRNTMVLIEKKGIANLRCHYSALWTRFL